MRGEHEKLRVGVLENNSPIEKTASAGAIRKETRDVHIPPAAVGISPPSSRPRHSSRFRGNVRGTSRQCACISSITLISTPLIIQHPPGAQPALLPKQPPCFHDELSKQEIGEVPRGTSMTHSMICAWGQSGFRRPRSFWVLFASFIEGWLIDNALFR